MRQRSARCSPLVGLVIASLFPCRAVLGQEVQASLPPDAQLVANDASLARIRQAVAAEPAIRLGDGARFYLQVVAKQPTFADYIKWSDLRLEQPVPPSETYGRGGGGGIDVLQLISSGVQWFRNAQRDRKVRQVRQQIDRELQALVSTDRSHDP